MKQMKLGIFTILLLSSNLALAQTMEKESTSPKKFVIRIGMGANFYDLKAINDRFVDKDFYGGSLGNDLNVLAGAAYFIVPNLSINFNVSYFIERLVGEGGQILCDPVSCPELFSNSLLQTRLFLPSLGIQYHVFSRRFDYFWGVGSALGLGNFQIKEMIINRGPATAIVSDLKSSFVAYGFGYFFNTGFSYQLSRVFYSVFEVGYRKMETGEFQRGDEYFYVDDLNFDFSGPYISAGIAFRF